MTQIELIEDAIYKYPLVLLTIQDKKLIDQINKYLPYSIGIEIECDLSPNFDLDNFKNIPDIIEVRIDASEQRFRIPNGLSGMICLYNICEQLKVNSLLNLGSGHHYHVDMTNSFHALNANYIEDNEHWMLKELDTWGYTGSYNKRRVAFDMGHNWIRFQNEFKTAEFRIGNMTFDYEIIIKRLIHASQIITRLITPLNVNLDIKYKQPNIPNLETIINCNNTKINTLYKQLEKLNPKPIVEDDDNVYRKEVIKNRVIKL